MIYKSEADWRQHQTVALKPSGMHMFIPQQAAAVQPLPQDAMREYRLHVANYGHCF